VRGQRSVRSREWTRMIITKGRTRRLNGAPQRPTGLSEGLFINRMGKIGRAYRAGRCAPTMRLCMRRRRRQTEAGTKKVNSHIPICPPVISGPQPPVSPHWRWWVEREAPYVERRTGPGNLSSLSIHLVFHPADADRGLPSFPILLAPRPVKPVRGCTAPANNLLLVIIHISPIG